MASGSSSYDCSQDLFEDDFNELSDAVESHSGNNLDSDDVISDF
jgi:hypothetical protein